MAQTITVTVTEVDLNLYAGTGVTLRIEFAGDVDLADFLAQVRPRPLPVGTTATSVAPLTSWAISREAVPDAKVVLVALTGEQVAAFPAMSYYDVQHTVDGVERTIMRGKIRVDGQVSMEVTGD